MDHHVPAAITSGLRARGIDVLTAFEDGTAECEDDALLQRATEMGRVLFSQDRDLLAIARRWQHSARPFAGVVYAHQLGITIGQAIKDLELIAAVCEPEDMENWIEFLPF
jgi:predicted nuclease of predicted toxin-antitoxin system